MRIESVPPKELLNRYSRVREKAAEASNTSRADEAQLTEQAKVFSTALKAAKESLEVQDPSREVRIAEVAQKIKDGTYSIPGRDVAEKMLGKNPEL